MIIFRSVTLGLVLDCPDINDSSSVLKSKINFQIKIQLINKKLHTQILITKNVLSHGLRVKSFSASSSIIFFIHLKGDKR